MLMDTSFSGRGHHGKPRTPRSPHYTAMLWITGTVALLVIASLAAKVVIPAFSPVPVHALAHKSR